MFLIRIGWLMNNGTPTDSVRLNSILTASAIPHKKTAKKSLGYYDIIRMHDHCSFVARSFLLQSYQRLQLIRYRLSIGLSASVRLQGGPIDLQSLTMWYAVWGSSHWHRLSSPNLHFTIASPNFPIPVRNLFSWTQAFRVRLCPRGLFDQSWMCGCSLCGIGSC